MDDEKGNVETKVVIPVKTGIQYPIDSHPRKESCYFPRGILRGNDTIEGRE